MAEEGLSSFKKAKHVAEYPCLSAAPNRLRLMGAPRILRNHAFFVNFQVINIIIY
jgi:hypothetical protein